MREKLECPKCGSEDLWIGTVVTCDVDLVINEDGEFEVDEVIEYDLPENVDHLQNRWNADVRCSCKDCKHNWDY